MNKLGGKEMTEELGKGDDELIYHFPLYYRYVIMLVGLV